MNKKYRLPLLFALTFALAACGDDKDGHYTDVGPDGAPLPNQGDPLNTNGGDNNGIPQTGRLPGNINPDSADYQTLAADVVYFDFDKATVSPSERGKLAAVNEWFRSHPGHYLFLAGHADKRGTPEYNRALGERRALAVREYLVGLGLPAASLYTNSYGSDRPAVDGDTEEAYAKNRRVEIGVIVQKP